MNTVTVTLPAEVVFPCAKANKDYTINPGELASHIILAVFRNGLVQKVGDSTSQVATSAKIDGRKVPLKGKELAAATSKAQALADECVANLVKGVWGKTRSSSGDPVETRARQIAIRVIGKSAEFKAWLGENGLKAVDEKATTELASRANARIESDSSIREVAARQIADEAMLAEDGDESQAEAA